MRSRSGGSIGLLIELSLKHNRKFYGYFWLVSNSIAAKMGYKKYDLSEFNRSQNLNSANLKPKKKQKTFQFFYLFFIYFFLVTKNKASY